jgi:RNA polymerase sigma-70 factor (ECF subfamily)
VNFDEAVRTHARDLYRFAFWLARDRHLAEDIVQEALLRGWRAQASLKEGAAVKAWLFTIVRNEFYRARGGAPALEGLEDAVSELADPRANLFGLEMRDALGALPAGLGEPLALQVLGGFSCAEIAGMLQTSEGAVMTRLTRARQALRRLVEPTRARKGGEA